MAVAATHVDCATPAEVPKLSAASVSDVKRLLHETNRTHVYITALDGADVVAKRFKMSDEEALLRYHQEKDMLSLLSASCSRVVSPVGYVVEPPTYSVVIPLYAKGAMDEVLHSPQSPELRWPLRLLFMRDICLAVQHAHRLGVVIRDIKPANFLVDQKLFGRLSDLELARTEEQLAHPAKLSYGGPSSRRKTRFEGTPEFMAPELLCAPGSALQRGIVRGCRATDIYAVGIALNEVATGQVPYTDVQTTTEQLNTVVETRYTPTKLTTAIVEEGLRPNLPKSPHCPAALIELVQRCWAHDPEQRPSIDECVSAIDGIIAAAGVDVDAERTQFVVEGPRPPDPEPAAAAAASPEEEDAAEELRSWPEVLSEIAASPPEGRAGWMPKLVRARGEGTAGRRELMEDTWSVVQWHGSSNGVGAQCFTCFDGHGGRGCADYMASALPPMLERAIRQTPGDVSGALTRGFVAAEAEWQRLHGADDPSGACAVAAVVLGSHLWVAWCGDCRAVVSTDGVARVLTTDHHPSLQSERKRVEAAGGTVSQTRDGKLRLAGKVCVTRSFGDPRRFQGSTAVPDVVHIPLRGEELLILATDGVWDVMTPQLVVDNLGQTVRHEDYGAKRVVSDAWTCGSTDNIGAVVAYLSDKGYVGKPGVAPVSSGTQ